jgi:DNA-binding MarR family transcriptional regulator
VTAQDTHAELVSDLESATLRIINVIAYSGHGRAMPRLFARATGIVLPGAEVRTFVALSSPVDRSTSELATVLGLDIGQASRQVSTLVDAGLAQRRTDPTDRRRTLVTLSDSGLVAADAWRSAWIQDYLAPVLDRPATDLRALADWLDRVRAMLVVTYGPGTGRGLPPQWHRPSGADPDDAALRSYLETVVEVVEIVGRSRGFENLLERLGSPVTHSVYLTLRVIARHGPLAMTEVATRTGAEPSRASKRVRTLTEHGLAERIRRPEDRRVLPVRVSSAGAELIRRVHEEQTETFRTAMGPVSAADRARWTGPVVRLADRLTRPSRRHDP